MLILQDDIAYDIFAVLTQIIAFYCQVVFLVFTSETEITKRLLSDDENCDNAHLLKNFSKMQEYLSNFAPNLNP
jgi:hypothetical protein